MKTTIFHNTSVEPADIAMQLTAI